MRSQSTSINDFTVHLTGGDVIQCADGEGHGALPPPPQREPTLLTFPRASCSAMLFMYTSLQGIQTQVSDLIIIYLFRGWPTERQGKREEREESVIRGAD